VANKVIITCAVTGAIHTPSMSPHLPITPDEIAQATCRQTQRHERRDEISHIEPSFAMRSRKPPQRNDDAKKSAVKRHAPFPHIEDAPRLRDIISQLVEQHVPQASAGNHADDAVEQSIVEILGGERYMLARFDGVASERP